MKMIFFKLQVVFTQKIVGILQSFYILSFLLFKNILFHTKISVGIKTTILLIFKSVNFLNIKIFNN